MARRLQIVMRIKPMERIYEGGTLMGARKRRQWRELKSRRRQQASTKPFRVWRPETIDDDESAEAEEIDRLLLSSLRLWEVERDLIEERMATRSR